MMLFRFLSALLAIILAFIPSYIGLAVWNFIDPSTFWEKCAVFAACAVVLAGPQWFCLFFFFDLWVHINAEF